MPVYRRGFHRAALREQLFTLGGGHAQPLVERAGIEPVFLLWLSHFSPQGPAREPSHVPGFRRGGPVFPGCQKYYLSVDCRSSRIIDSICLYSSFLHSISHLLESGRIIRNHISVTYPFMAGRNFTVSQSCQRKGNIFDTGNR